VKILIAEDEAMSRLMLEAILTEWGYEVVVAAEGVEALQILEGADAPRLAILDWMMPGLDGPEVCRRLRARPRPEPPYLILLTGRRAKGDIVAGLKSGANDFITKPYDREELQARVQVGCRVVELQGSLATRVRELEEALTQVKQLQGLLPVCCYCKKIRDDHNYWQQVEEYFGQHSDIHFTHGICPECWESEVKTQLEQWTEAGQAHP
jgi:sigma-B regulation protein RsbU (phosphoserine phosphatase)